MADNSLNARKMNMNPGGKQPIMRAGWFVRHGIRFTQHMVFEGGPQAGIAKGLRAECEERFGVEAVIGKSQLNNLRGWAALRYYRKNSESTRERGDLKNQIFGRDVTT